MNPRPILPCGSGCVEQAFTRTHREAANKATVMSDGSAPRTERPWRAARTQVQKISRHKLRFMLMASTLARAAEVRLRALAYDAVGAAA
ncbi:hypothetical protein GH5_05931 [Leishmania sp. Ghana 2012 LV757]|uniref:hypothetical protein n=1 Tax=Leishmania sp. Ghana 2012 LV757 TaxID=2803181 RepID=UPI001B7C985F|nr:hypothetical protein GH5_05931 [Leishmania sp. Ghana 2012 LV757]